MFENGEWVEEGTIHLSEDQMKGFMKDFAKYMHGDKNEK